MRRTVLALAGLLIPLAVLSITKPVLATASPPVHPLTSSSTGPIGDVNQDGTVDLFDLVIITAAYNPTGSAADPRADTNDDDVVNLLDLVRVTTSFGATSPDRAPTSAVFPENTYLLHEERIIGGYTVRLWRDPVFSLALSGVLFSDVLTIDADRQPRVQIESVSGLDDLTGSDVTGEGHPDVVIHTFTGGAHCCFSTVIYDLGPTMTKVLETPESNCPTTLLNVDSDAALECLTCDDLFAYVYCAYAGSPMAKVILDYVPGEGYVPASPRFAYLYASDIAAHRVDAERAMPGDYGEWDETTKCGVLQIVLDYLYSGMPYHAWSELYRLYQYPDVHVFRAEVEQAVYSSPLFTPH